MLVAILLSGPAQDASSAAAAFPAKGTASTVKVGLFDWLFGGGGRTEPPRSRQEERQRHPQGDSVPRGEDEDRDDDTQRSRQSTTYRTLCVRLCDGFYFPISFSVTRDRFSRDAQHCEQSCPQRSRLYVYRNPGEAPEAMVDLQGKAYRDLPAAFRYQTQYVADCTCHGNPWDQEALERHRGYAQSSKPPVADSVAAQQPVVQPGQRPMRQSRWMERQREPESRGRSDDD